MNVKKRVSKKELITKLNSSFYRPSSVTFLKISKSRKQAFKISSL